MTKATDQVLDALASDYLLSLTNNGDSWSIAYRDDTGKINLEPLTDADFDGLLLRWYRELAIIEERAASKASERAYEKI